MADKEVRDAEVYKSVVGGKLSLKGIDFKKKKKKSKRKHEEDDDGVSKSGKVERERAAPAEPDEPKPEDMLTAAQKRYLQTMRDRAAESARKQVQETHREKVEKFNSRLANLTEHNDIPRISAAGNG